MLFACNTPKNQQPAEDALDAAREFKDACLKGDFDKAKFYLLPNKTSENKFRKIIESTHQQSTQQTKESKEASIVINAFKEISRDKSQIILSNSFDKNVDTIFVVHQNNLWLVDLQ